MSKRSMEFKMPKHPKLPDSGLPESTGNVMNTIAKWVPLICAGAAIGVSIIALKEIQSVKKELTLSKKNVPDEELAKRLEIMELQLKNLSDFIMVPRKTAKHVNPKKSPNVNVLDQVIKNAMNPQTETKIINENEKYDPTEYEEVEVTDDETE